MPRDHRDRRIVGRVDGGHSKAETFREEGERLVEIAAGQDHLCARVHGSRA
jgi:hypothetical protein